MKIEFPPKLISRHVSHVSLATCHTCPRSPRQSWGSPPRRPRACGGCRRWGAGWGPPPPGRLGVKRGQPNYELSREEGSSDGEILLPPVYPPSTAVSPRPVKLPCSWCQYHRLFWVQPVWVRVNNNNILAYTTNSCLPVFGDTYCWMFAFNKRSQIRCLVIPGPAIIEVNLSINPENA